MYFPPQTVKLGYGPGLRTLLINQRHRIVSAMKGIRDPEA